MRSEFLGYEALHIHIRAPRILSKLLRPSLRQKTFAVWRNREVGACKFWYPYRYTMSHSRGPEFKIRRSEMSAGEYKNALAYETNEWPYTVLKLMALRLPL